MSEENEQEEEEDEEEKDEWEIKKDDSNRELSEKKEADWREK